MASWRSPKSLAVRAVLLLPICYTLDIMSLFQHKLLISGPYLPPGQKVDAGIILGYALKRDGTPTGPLRTRVRAGVNLFDKVIVDHLIFSGGHPGGGIRGQSEAQAMETYATELSRRKDYIRWIKEEQSTSTRTNALFSLELVKKRRWRAVVIVTNSFHQFRSRLVFKCAAKQIYGHEDPPKVWLASVPDELSSFHQLLYEPMIKQWNFLRELLAIVWYWYKGWLC